MAKINHMSHGLGPVRDGHAHSDIARNGAPKKLHGIEVAFNQRTRSGSTDILSGAAKRLTVTAPAFGQRSRGPNPGANLHALGSAMLAEAFAAGDAMDCAAHGRNKDGSK
jgi:hypothetical protein